MARILDLLRTQKWQNFFFLYDQIKLYLKNQAVQIENVLSKNVYSEIRAGYETRPTEQARFEEQFPDICLDWHDIYKLPFNVLIDRASDRSRNKTSNFAGFLGTNSRKNRPISGDLPESRGSATARNIRSPA